jgi:hypothetical protein
MSHRALKLSAGAVAITLGVALFASEVASQQKQGNELVGAWAIVSSDTVRPDGNRSPTFDRSPKGILILDGTGHYALELMRAELPKFSSNNRVEGTPDENKAVVQGVLAHYGRYTVNDADHSLTFHIDASSFPNWSGTEQKRPFTVSGDELRWKTAAASGGGSAELVWRRAK